MSKASWTKPPYAGRLVTCAVVAAIHAILLISYRPQHAAVSIRSNEGNRAIWLVPPRIAPSAVKSGSTSKSIIKPSQSIAKKDRQTATLSGQRVAPDTAAAPDEVAADDEVLAVEPTADIDPNWTAGQSVKPSPIADIKAYSLSLAGKADAESRQGKLAALDPVDTPFKRMQRKMAQAARGGGNSTTTAYSSSGEPITVITRNGKLRCYAKVSTSVAPSAVFDNRGSGRSSEIQCPKEMQ